MKKLLNVLGILTIFTFSCGFVKDNTILTIDDKDNLNIEETYLLNDNFSDDYLKNITNLDNYKRDNLNVQVKKENGYTGIYGTSNYKLKDLSRENYKTIKISDFLSKDFDDKTLIKVDKSFFKNKYTVKYVYERKTTNYEELYRNANSIKSEEYDKCILSQTKTNSKSNNININDKDIKINNDNNININNNDIKNNNNIKNDNNNIKNNTDIIINKNTLTNSNNKTTTKKATTPKKKTTTTTTKTETETMTTDCATIIEEYEKNQKELDNKIETLKQDMEYTFKVVIPREVIETNADVKSDDGKELTWNFKEGVSEVNFVFEIPNMTNIYIVFGGIIFFIIIITILIISIKKKQKKVENILEDKPIHADYDPSIESEIDAMGGFINRGNEEELPEVELSQNSPTEPEKQIEPKEQVIERKTTIKKEEPVKPMSYEYTLPYEIPNVVKEEEKPKEPIFITSQNTKAEEIVIEPQPEAIQIITPEITEIKE